MSFRNAILSGLLATVVPHVSLSAEAAAGAQVYDAQKCALCHKVGDKGGKLGPDLSSVGVKRDAAWLARYLANPKAESPTNKMPAVKVTGRDLDNLVDYLLSLKK